MTDERQEERSFLQELLRRHVVSSAIAYAVGAWVLIQVVDVMGPAYGAPEWTVRALSTVMLLLFPAFLVFTWEFDVTRRGLQRTGDDLDAGLSARPWFRRSIVGVITAASLGAVWFTWTTGVLTDAVPVKSDEFPKVIAVDGFQAFTDDESAWLGDGIANLVRDNLAQSRYLRVVSLRRWQALREQGTDPLEVAADAGITYLVQGEIIGSRSGHVLTVRLTDTRDGEQLDAQTFEVADGVSLLDRATAVAQGARARLKIPLEERVDVFAADHAAENPSAYRAFVGALDYWNSFHYSDAARLFEAALDLEPNFTMARYYHAWSLASQDQLAEAVRQLEIAAATESLNPRDKLYIDALKSLLEEGGTTNYRELVEQYPNDTEARQLLAEAYARAYDDQNALRQYEALAQLEPEVQTGWSGVAYYQVQLGNYSAARPAVEKFMALAPDNANAYTLRGDVNRAEGRFDEAKADYRRALELAPELADAAVSLARTSYLEGDSDEALRQFDALIRDEGTVPRYRLDAAFEAGGILMAKDDPQPYVDYLDLLNQQFVDSEIFYAKALAEKALATMAMTGPTEDVVRIVEESIDNSPGVPTRYLFAKALVELEANDLEAASQTAAAIRDFALPAEDPDRTEDKAADYLQGVAAAKRGDHDQALSLLQRAVDADGYQYRHYALELARVHIALGAIGEARDLLRVVADDLDFAQPRLDLEADRAAARALIERL